METVESDDDFAGAPVGGSRGGRAAGGGSVGSGVGGKGGGSGGVTGRKAKQGRRGTSPTDEEEGPPSRISATQPEVSGVWAKSEWGLGKE